MTRRTGHDPRDPKPEPRSRARKGDPRYVAPAPVLDRPPVYELRAEPGGTVVLHEGGTPAVDAASWVPIAELEPWDRNPKKNDHRIAHGVRLLREFGFITPMVRDRERGWLVGGNLRLKAMRRILEDDPKLERPANATLRGSLRGPTVQHVPVALRSFASEGHAEAYAIVDNAQIGEWDTEALAAAVERLSAADIVAADLVAASDMKRLLNTKPTVDPQFRPDKEARFAVIVEFASAEEQALFFDETTGRGIRCRLEF